MRIKWKEDYSARTQRCWGAILGVVVGLLIGIPIGWGATKFPSDTSFVLALITAIGTIGSAVGAVVISFWAQQHSQKMEVESSKRYALASVDTMISANRDIQRALVLKQAATSFLNPSFERLPDEAYELIERAWIRLSSLDFERLSHAMPEHGAIFVKLKVNFGHQIDLLPQNKEDPSPLNDMVLNDIQADLKRMWDFILSSCQR
ncbi:hypothetical protein [Alcaligenes sp. SMD-FA]|uniref:hypothetical protein n=1 Tax=Alcaligenes sp. SMD-FA TaxID=2991054 RepID=UPI002226B5BB|nr:hypothetical protein [Alcaligenes sp. SMD-FA]UYY88090.1 hypothetical protein OKX01_04070 [Alcaligenes sp. SMD-FA]